MGTKISEKVYKSILKEIIDGVYTPRDFISEAQIAKKYNVSKAPVKEALHILASEGFLVSYPKRGYMINIYTVEDMNKIQAVRRALAPLVIKEVIQNATDEEIKKLQFYRTHESMQYDPGETVNTRFHIGLARLSGNEFLVDALYPLVVKASFYNIKRCADTNNFDNVVEALISRDEEKALEALLDDVRFL